MCAAGAEALHVFVLAINPAVVRVGDEVSMAEVIRQAAAAHHYPAVFDDHTEEPLYLGRSRRLAPKAQRIVLYAKDRGYSHDGHRAFRAAVPR